MLLSTYTQSWLLLVPLIPSILISIFNLYHLLKDRALRHALNNHVIICLLFFGLMEELTDIALHVQFYRTGIVLIRTPAFCLFWIIISSSLLVSIYWLMAWASIERHIFIFYPHCFATSKKLFFDHYFPLILYICVFSSSL
ncbi:unnamed protein product [Adineta ricciae]|uniref:Uncharacterized protein n=1 Tax=Adineta ricciae TaxID=249248 RepID=A0A815GWC2_ADIRI|nr:unnamed protein product [Adineta ricciae]CAF1424812.1 unnamed protein product [Adineta ricciae]